MLTVTPLDATSAASVFDQPAKGLIADLHVGDERKILQHEGHVQANHICHLLKISDDLPIRPQGARRSNHDTCCAKMHDGTGQFADRGKTGAETPTTTGTLPARAITRLAISVDSAWVIFGASPIIPRIVKPSAPASR